MAADRSGLEGERAKGGLDEVMSYHSMFVQS